MKPAGRQGVPATRRRGRVPLLLSLLGVASAGAWLAGRAGETPAGTSALTAAVLPFDTPSGEGALAEGFALDLAAQLGRVAPQRLAVAAAASARLAARDPLRAAAELGVRYVVRGSRRLEASRVLLDVELIDAGAAGAALISDSYRREAAGFPALAGALARRIARRLGVPAARGAAGRLRAAEAPDTDAYLLYLDGRASAEQERGEAALRRAIDKLERAAARRPGYALAEAALANAYRRLAELGHAAPSEIGPLVARSAERALQLAEGLPEAHAARSWGLAYQSRWESARLGFEKTLQLAPHCGGAELGYARYWLMLGRFDEARARRKRALELDPLSPTVHEEEARALLAEGRPAEAEAAFRRLLARHPGWPPAQLGLGRALLALGQAAAGLASLEQAAERAGGGPEYVAALAVARAAASQPRLAEACLRALQELSQSRYVSSYDLAVAHLAVGERDAAFAFLEKAHVEGQGALGWLPFDERLAALRGDARYAELLRRLRLKG